MKRDYGESKPAKPRPWERKPCTCAVCKAKADLARVREVDTDSYHGTGAVESLQFKVSYMESALENLLGALRCEKDGTPDDA